jgi:hypothetical protein
MKRQSVIALALLVLALTGSGLGAEDQITVVIHAGRLFAGTSDALSSNQEIVIRGDRIADVGPAGSVEVPAGAEEIDLRNATVLPGLIDGHAPTAGPRCGRLPFKERSRPALSLPSGPTPAPAPSTMENKLRSSKLWSSTG